MTLPLPTRAIEQTNARGTVLRFAFGLAIITYLDRICISAAARSIMRDLGLSMLEMGVVFSAFTLAYSLFEVPAGWLGDVKGARSVLTRIVVWWSAFTMLTGAAWNYLSLVAIRFLFGAGEAGAFPNMARSFASWFPLAERGRANGILFLGSRLGGAVAPPLALVLIRYWGWRVSFAVFGAIGFFWAAAWHRWYRDDPACHPAVGGEELRWIRSDTTEETGARPQVPWKRILTSRNLYAIIGMYFTYGYGLYFYFTWLPTYLVDVLGFSGVAGGFFSSLPFLLAGSANMLGGWLTDRLAARAGLRAARCWLGSASFATCALLLLGSIQVSQPWLKAALLAFALGSVDLALSACWAVCLDVGRDHAGVITGFMNSFGNLGGFLGPMVVGYAVQRWNSWTVPFYISSAVYAAGALLWLTIDPQRRFHD